MLIGVASFSTWHRFEPGSIGGHAPSGGGVYQVKVAGILLKYPRGRSAMIYYGATSEPAPGLRELLGERWMVPGAGPRQHCEGRGDLLWRSCVDATPEHLLATLLRRFERRFGSLPAGNVAELAARR